MHSWAQILGLSSEQRTLIFSYYKSPFSLEVRQVLAPWIQHTFQNFDYIDSENLGHCQRIEEIISSLINELELKATNRPYILSSNICESIALTATNIRFHFPNIALDLFKHIRNCLQLESDVLMGQPRLEEFVLLDPTKFSLTSFENFKSHHEHLMMYWNGGMGQGNGNLLVLQQSQMSTYGNLCAEFLKEFEEYFTKLRFELTARTTFRLAKHKEEREILSQGKLSHPFTVELNELEIYYKYYANQLRCLLSLIKKVEGYFGGIPPFLKCYLNAPLEMKVQTLKSRVQDLLKNIVSQSFVVSVQPSHLVVKDTIARGDRDFPITVQLLVGDQIGCPDPIKATCYALDEVQALNAIMNPGHPPTTCGNLENNSEELSSENDYSAVFGYVMLRGHITRLKKKFPGYDNTSYYDENNWFYFYAEIIVDDIQFKLGVFSKPVKLTTNAKQKPICMSTMLYDIAAGRFGVVSVLGRPPVVHWKDFEMAFLVWFENLNGCGLDLDDLVQIKQKLFSRDYFEKITENPLTEFTLKKLRDPNPGIHPAFSFGDWLYCITRFIWKCLGPQRKQTQDGRILDKPGLWHDRVFQNIFMTQQMSQNILVGRGNGAFLVRFSYSTTDAITVDFVANGKVYPHRCTSDDLKNRPLMDRISDIPVWVLLCPGNILRNDLIRDYALPRDPSVPLKPGYVSAVIQILNQFTTSTSHSTSLPSLQNPTAFS